MPQSHVLINKGDVWIDGVYINAVSNYTVDYVIKDLKKVTIAFYTTDVEMHVPEVVEDG